MEIIKGIPRLTFSESQLEYNLQKKFEKMMEEKGFLYLSIPTSVPIETFVRQEIATDTYMLEWDMSLAGSAEQGILDIFSDSVIHQPQRIWTINQCFRKEDSYDEIHYKEFKKLEQYIFTDEIHAKMEFDKILHDTVTFMEKNGFKVRTVDESRDEGYHVDKVDIQVFSPALNDWIETHSCSYFGTEQSERFGFTGEFNHTISCTGLAFPRVLLGLDVDVNIIS